MGFGLKRSFLTTESCQLYMFADSLMFSLHTFCTLSHADLRYSWIIFNVMPWCSWPSENWKLATFEFHLKCFLNVNDRAALTLFASSSSPAIIQLCWSPCAKFALNLWLNNHFRNHIDLSACALRTKWSVCYLSPTRKEQPHDV